MRKKFFHVLLAIGLLLTVLCLGGCSEKALETDADTVRVFALKGPTGMGMAKLMKDNDNGEAVNHYDSDERDGPTGK